MNARQVATIAWLRARGYRPHAIEWSGGSTLIVVVRRKLRDGTLSLRLHSDGTYRGTHYKHQTAQSGDLR